MKYLEQTEIFHGSLEEVTIPQILIANQKKNADFGDGFYCTSSPEQAINWTRKKMDKFSKSEGYVNQYSIEKEKLKTLNIKIFEKANEEWIDFVIENRNKKEHNYDIVYGPVADDDTNRQMNKYEKGEITKKELLERLEDYKLVDQYLFHTDKALQCLKFVSSKKEIKQTNKLNKRRVRKGGPKL